MRDNDLTELWNQYNELMSKAISYGMDAGTANGIDSVQKMIISTTVSIRINYQSYRKMGMLQKINQYRKLHRNRKILKKFQKKHNKLQYKKIYII